ncbi:hypothetical protein QLS71_016840 [Mariniflexile litorale]|uniref:SGNH/GDSL hydrolase family protein n=1 Tax=Mariniflexile litorale TaxID=3045158 RepID=A0AAU7ED02_9FLAO|nr:hypothetical protein [Mariniflexile sp. KMM 9835]MDQ8211511.1 hypothetical protein [Mariniflexile sp. KMM 9835]
MRKFIIKCFGFFLIVIFILSIILVEYGSYIDFFYNKFTTPKSKSLIIGDSRGLQGIQPSIINKELKNSNLELPILNYSFTIAQAHIGELYRKSILKKLDPKSKNGIFIISITPWMLGSKKENNNYAGEFKEAGTPPHNMTFVDLNPNFEYLLKNLNYFNFKGVFKKNSILHKDGWLEANNLPKDSITFNAWKQTQLDIFNGFIKDYKVSDYRKKSLDTLIKNLKEHGKVILVRSPIDKEMLDLENTFFPDFNLFIEGISERNNAKFLNYTNKFLKIKFQTYDGHHLDKFGGVVFSKSICDSIINLKY